MLIDPLAHLPEHLSYLLALFGDAATVHRNHDFCMGKRLAVCGWHGYRSIPTWIEKCT
jgi:hypothetical protein